MLELRRKRIGHSSWFRVAEQPHVTVVTVVHDGEAYLDECIESVLAQTYSNWEYVLVDNRSTDRTPEIAERFVRADSRVRYERHEEFVGVVESHNRGFRAVGPSTSYCKFVGADDWIFPECLERMVALAEREPNVGVVSGYRLHGQRVDLVGLPYSQATMGGRETIAHSLLSSFPVTGTPTALLFRADLVRARVPFHDVSFRHSDTEACYWALMRSNFGVVHQVVTYHRGVPSPETRRSGRLSSYRPDRLRMLLRYGPEVMTSASFRQLLRERLAQYVVQQRRLFLSRHTKGLFMPSHRADKEAIAYHAGAIGMLAAEAPHDRDVQRAVRALRFYLR
jgi:glycosyltransferase involved in cell wall biosynthesis